MPTTNQRYITVWRKPAPDVLDWDFHTTEVRSEIPALIANLKGRGVHQYHTYPIGDKIADFSSEY